MSIRLGDCLEQMQSVENDSVDSVVTDPPYGISFMGKKWDYDVPKVEVWEEALRVLKAGGHILVACGTRTQHRMAVNIEDAGFEIRDIVAWVYGSGFPKSHNIGKAVARLQGEDIPKTKGFNVAGQGIGLNPNKELRSDNPNYVKPTFDNEYEGWGTALKPAMELWTLARKPLSEKTVAENVLKWGTGGINIDECRVGIDENDKNNRKPSVPDGNSDDSRNCYGKGLTGRPIPNLNQQGRFPANLIHDGSDEVVGLFPDTKSSEFKMKRMNDADIDKQFMVSQQYMPDGGFNDSGSASRFFYCAKASKSERNVGLEGFETKQTQGGGGGIGDYKDDVNSSSGKYGSEKAPAKNNHPTVKPVKLMQYLTRLITPKGGIVLDPYMGSGTTGIACKKEGFEFIGIELDEDYFEIAKARIEKLEYQHELF